MRKIYRGTPSQMEAAYQQLVAEGMFDPSHLVPDGERGLLWQKPVALSAGPVGARVEDREEPPFVADYPCEDVLGLEPFSNEVRRVMEVSETHRRLQEFADWAKEQWPDRAARRAVVLSVAG